MGEFKNEAVKAMVVMRKAFRAIDTYVGASFKEDKLTSSQFAVLDLLAAKGEMTVGELVKGALATSGNMTLVVKNMERKGWVTRRPSEKDKRAFVIGLTAAGQAKIDQALPHHIERIETIFSRLTVLEQEQLIALLKKFKD